MNVYDRHSVMQRAIGGEQTYDFSNIEVEGELIIRLYDNTRSIKFNGSKFNDRVKIISSSRINVSLDNSTFKDFLSHRGFHSLLIN